MYLQIGTFDDSERITQAITVHGDIYVLMSYGKFGKFRADPEFALQYLACIPGYSSMEPFLFIK